ncbi:MAG TPA: O-antigen ligase family protein [Gemmatimonadaceae bacterium]|nr:O-antigen ligase family protein [Gemmatimonadaceae bacterium]
MASPQARTANGTPRARLDFQQRLTYVLWIVILFDPQFLLASVHLTFALRVPLVLTVALAVSLVVKPGRGEWFIGMIAWLALMAIDMPFAYNRGVAMGPFRTMILFYLIGLSVVRGLRQPRSIDFIFFTLCVVQYLWWGGWGIHAGLVSWHPNLDNFDGYGPLMACGVGPAYYYACATRNRWKRRVSFVAAGMCIIGVVSAFARGSVLALVVTVGYIWLRSPNKKRATALIAVGLVLVAIAASLIDGTTRGDDTRANFWDEMSTMFDDSAGSTGDDREHLWRAATIVFRQHPILGVGANNFGPAAVTLIAPGEIKGAAFADNPDMLYSRALHSNYFQLLSELGLAGVAIYTFMIGQFWLRSRFVLRTARSIDLSHGGVPDPRNLALGLESGMVAYLVTGVFFNQIYTAWFFCLLFANALLYHRAVAARRARSPQLTGQRSNPMSHNLGFPTPRSSPALHQDATQTHF